MPRPLVINEGPFVFLRNVLVMEFIAFGFFYALSFLSNYEMLYKTLWVSKYLHYNAFDILIFSIFQLLYLALLFLDWYFSNYEIHEKEIVRKSGLLFRHRKTVSLADVVAVDIYQSPLSRMIKHATIILEHSSGRVTKIKNVPRFEERIHYIKQLLPSNRGKRRGDSLAEMLKNEEDLFLEFKETLRFDARNGSSSKELEKAVTKTIVGFMNAEGGTLLIGVNDDGEVMGLDRDYKTLPRKDRDGFENHLNMLVKTMIGLPFTKYVRVTFEKIDGKEVCIVSVKESHKPTYLNSPNNSEEFYVRVGNSTQPFSISQAEEYIRTNWK
jgi:membrane protein YdbS with pleckstrin-like domain